MSGHKDRSRQNNHSSENNCQKACNLSAKKIYKMQAAFFNKCFPKCIFVEIPFETVVKVIKIFLLLSIHESFWVASNISRMAHCQSEVGVA